MEGKTAAEVKVRLVVDSNARAVAADVAKHLGGVESKANKARKGIDASLKGNLASLKTLALAGTGLATAAAVAAGGAFIGLAVKSYHAWGEAASQIKEIAGSLAVVDRNANSFQSLFEYGDQIKESMEEIGIKSGQSSDATVHAFNNIIEHGGKTVEQTTELVEEMAMAGKVVPGGLQSIASGYEQIQLGMVRARNPLVQLISSTGTLKGSAKEVAKQMLKMTPEKQMELAEQALGKMSKKMKDLPLSIGGMKAGMEIVYSNLFENAGKPITNALKPAFKLVHGWITENQEAIYAAGESFGEWISKGLGLVTPVLEELGAAVRDNWNEIRSAFEAIYGPGQELFEYIYEHRGEFAKTMGDVARVMIKAATFIVNAMAKVRDAIAFVAKHVGGTVLNAASMGEWGKLQREQSVTDATKDVRGTVMGAYGGFGQASETMKMEARAKFLETVGASTAEEQAKAIQDFDSVWKRAWEDHDTTMRQVRGLEQAARMADTSSFVKAWKTAQEAQDTGAMAYVSHFLDSSKELQKVLGEEGPKLLGDGFKKLMDTLKETGDKTVIAGIKEAAKPKLGISSKTSINQNFNGPITVKQDFRDQDPDRVALVFREDLAKVGSSRLQSRFASPFGF